MNPCVGGQQIQEITLYDKYARWMPDQQRRETWPEVVERVLTFFQRTLARQGKRLEPALWAQLGMAMAQKDVLPSMRVVQMAGEALERCHVGAYNCAYLELDSPTALGELLYILMQGTGVGYSVERRATRQWPAVARVELGPTPVRVIEDSTEGWCKALVDTLVWSLDGWDPQWDFSAIRPEGTWLHTKGGRASGPEPLKQLLATAHTLIRQAAGRPLRPFEIHRLATLCGSIVQVGGVRRAAEIALFDADDAEMAACKDGAFWDTYPELAMANNSMVFTGAADPDQIHALVQHLQSVGSGEPGIFRRDGVIPERREARVFGTNPCGEIILRSRQFCNLSIAVARPTDTYQTLVEKVRLAALLGTIQSCLTSFRYLSPEWATNSAEERLLGVDITGTLDCPLLQPNPLLGMILDKLQAAAVQANEEAAQMLGITPSKAVTCNKPSGNSSQLLAASSGIHPRYGAYYVRRLRIGARSPLGLHLQALGLPVFPEVGQGTLEQARVWVVELPVKAPEGSVTRHHLTAAQQLDYWLQWKRHWTEHNPSCTIYVGKDEWAEVEAFLLAHWAEIGGLSFLPKDDHTYQLAPYEEISKADYEARLAQLPASLQLDTIRETLDLTTVAQDYACVGGVCEI
jgi:ribonucleoside-triphosphate reductase